MILALWMAVSVRMSCCYSVLKKIVVDQVLHEEFKTREAAAAWCSKFRGAQEACFLFEEGPPGLDSGSKIESMIARQPTEQDGRP